MSKAKKGAAGPWMIRLAIFSRERMNGRQGTDSLRLAKDDVSAKIATETRARFPAMRRETGRRTSRCQPQRGRERETRQAVKRERQPQSLRRA